MKEINLKPCPFCDGEAEISIGRNSFQDAEIECTKCYANIGCYDNHGDDESAKELNIKDSVKHWNKRSK